MSPASSAGRCRLDAALGEGVAEGLQYFSVILASALRTYTTTLRAASREHMSPKIYGTLIKQMAKQKVTLQDLLGIK